MTIGLVVGYFVGYFIVISRIDESGGVLAKALVMNMAPTAPDTLLAAAVEGVLGLIVGAMLPTGETLEGRYKAHQRTRDPEGYDHPNAEGNRVMDMRRLSTTHTYEEDEPETTVDPFGKMRTVPRVARRARKEGVR